MITTTEPIAEQSLRLRLSFACLFFLLISLLASSAYASQAGRPGFSGNPDTNSGATCNACHAVGAVAPTISFSGPSIVDANTSHNYTVTITGGPGVTGGLTVSASGGAGEFTALNADLQVEMAELVHSQPKAFAAGEVSFDFSWTAPAYNGDVTLYAAGNSSNGLLNLLGDGIGTDQLVVTVQNGTAPPPPDPQPESGDVTLTEVASGFSNPVVLRHAGDSRLFVAEQSGLIRILDKDFNVLAAPFLDITDRVDDGDNEQGLLGLAFHPDYATNGYFYVFYSVNPPSGPDLSRVSRFSVGIDPNLADSTSELILMDWEVPKTNHMGGDIHFGPDGYLYIAVGDGGNGGDPDNNAQNTLLTLGKMLRIDVDSSSTSDCNLAAGNHYGIPADNAFTDGVGGAGCDEIWALGLRNPWRFSFDRDNGDMWIADVGQNEFEEIDYLPAGTAAGLNFGWRCFEANDSFNSSGCTSGYFFPVYDPSHDDGNCSITGGFVYRPPVPTLLDGAYLFSDFCNTAIRSLRVEQGSVYVEDVVPAGAVALPSTFGEDMQGRQYVVSLNGQIYRIDAQVQVNIPAFPYWAYLVLFTLIAFSVIRSLRLSVS